MGMSNNSNGVGLPSGEDGGFNDIYYEVNLKEL